MSNPRNFRWASLVAVIGCALVCAVTATSALAAGGAWGELRRFGPGKALTITGTTNAFGVDPTTNDVFIGDESGNDKYRLQELDSNGTQLGSVSLTPKSVFSAEKLKGEPAGIEGVAVDAAHERVYVLALYEREEGTPADEEPIDEGIDDAGVLYAFSTKANSSKELVSATGSAEGVLAGPDALKAQGEANGESLLEPTGIAVDPTDGDVIILGEVDTGEELRHLAAQRISSEGVPGSRYVDPIEVGEAEEDEGTNSEESSSPIVTASGQVYAEQYDKIVQIPSSFAATAPTTLFALPPYEALLQLGAQRANAAFGGGLAVVPETSGGGTLFASTLVDANGAYYNGALALHYSDSATIGSASELGFTGGGNLVHGPQCIISLEGFKPQLAAGKEGHVLVFDPHVSQVIEFGPGGEGCPTAQASVPVATIAGSPLKEVGGVAEVPAGSTVTFSSTLTQANVLGVKWTYEEGQEAQAGSAQGSVAEGTHAFAKVGETTVTGTVETDDLATPTLTVQKKIKIVPQPPMASFTNTSAAPGEAVEFNGASSSDPSHAAITKYAWKFGDGQEETTTGPTVRHPYAAAGTYTATLTVTDSLGLEGSTSHPVTVATKTSGGGGGGSTGGGSSGGGSPTTSATPAKAATPPPPTAGVGGVLSYRASLASTALSVSSSGALIVKVDCAGQSSCSGTVTLRTLTAVAAGATTSKSKKSILTLATGSFTLAGGHTKAVTLHLSAKARKLLARSHALRARATILARDAQGVTHTTLITVTLRAAKAKPKHH